MNIDSLLESSNLDSSENLLSDPFSRFGILSTNSAFSDSAMLKRYESLLSQMGQLLMRQWSGGTSSAGSTGQQAGTSASTGTASGLALDENGYYLLNQTPGFLEGPDLIWKNFGVLARPDGAYSSQPNDIPVPDTEAPDSVQPGTASSCCAPDTDGATDAVSRQHCGGGRTADGCRSRSHGGEDSENGTTSLFLSALNSLIDLLIWLDANENEAQIENNNGTPELFAEKGDRDNPEDSTFIQIVNDVDVTYNFSELDA